MVTKTWGRSGPSESHFCVHAEDLSQGTDMKLDLHQIVTFRKNVYFIYADLLMDCGVSDDLFRLF